MLTLMSILVDEWANRPELDGGRLIMDMPEPYGDRYPVRTHHKWIHFTCFQITQICIPP